MRMIEVRNAFTCKFKMLALVVPHRYMGCPSRCQSYVKNGNVGLGHTGARVYLQLEGLGRRGAHA